MAIDLREQCDRVAVVVFTFAFVVELTFLDADHQPTFEAGDGFSLYDDLRKCKGRTAVAWPDVECS